MPVSLGPYIALLQERIPRIALPEELCLEIASYLDRKDLQNTYTINRAFFRIAVDALYHEVALLPEGGWSETEILAFLRPFSHPSIASRTRNLVLDSSTMWLKEPERTAGRRSLILPSRHTIKSKIRTLRNKSPTRPDKAHGHLFFSIQNFVANLRELHKISIRCHSKRSDLFLNTLSFLWNYQTQTLGPERITIRHLAVTLNGLLSLPVLALTLPLTYGEQRYRRALHRLESINIRVMPGFGDKYDSREMASNAGRALSVFMQPFTTLPLEGGSHVDSSFSSSLTSLSICMNLKSTSWPHEVWKGLLSGLMRPSDGPSPARQLSIPFPSLNHLTLVQTSRVKFAEECQFLKLHSRTITRLCISSGVDVSHFPPLRNLESLEVIGVESEKDPGVETLVAIAVKSESNVLRTLSVGRENPLNPTDLENMLRTTRYDSTPAGITSFTSNLRYKELLVCLRHFSVKLSHLTPTHLLLLASTLPGLQRLDVYVDDDKKPFRLSDRFASYYGPPSVYKPPSMVGRFCAELALYINYRRFSTWKATQGLQDLRVGCRGVERDSLIELKDLLKKVISPFGIVDIGNHVYQPSIFDGDD